MTNPEKEKLIDYLVVLDKPGREFTSESDTRWGGLIVPAPGENPAKTDHGLRVVLFGSWEGGYLMLETLKSIESQFPEQLNVAGLVTDDPLNPDARISVKKRIWGMVDMPERVIDETTIIEAALSHGAPVYTGEIKIESFRAMLKKWKPDVILVCVFGQLIDPFIIDLPPYGIYNFHPSDLSNRHGAGPAPYQDLAARGVDTTVWSVHHVSEEIDSGHIVGQSPPIYILNAEGVLPGDPFVVYNKVEEALGPMVIILTRELYRRYELKQTGPIVRVDFPALFPDDIKKKIMNPITRESPFSPLLDADLSMFL